MYASSTPPLGKVFHLVVTYDGAALVMYLDDVKVADDTGAVDVTARASASER